MKIKSILSLKASFSILGINIFNNLEDNYNHGFVFI